MIRRIIIITILCSVTLAFAQEKGKNPELAKLIDGLAVEDQKPYQRIQKGEISVEQGEKDFQETTKRNYVHLKKNYRRIRLPFL